jgi:hypothetical protein
MRLLLPGTLRRTNSSGTEHTAALALLWREPACAKTGVKAMDANQFDQLARSLTGIRTRRGMLGFLAALPFVGGLASRLGQAAVSAAGDRGQRTADNLHTVRASKKHKHKHKHKKRCKPDSTEKTCAGKCGLVKNNCKKTVDCGASHCPACQTCSGAACAPVANGAGCGGTNVCCNGACCNGCCGADGSCGLAIGETCTPTTPETPNNCCSGQCGCAGADCTCRNATCSPTTCDMIADCCQGTCAAGISMCF